MQKIYLVFGANGFIGSSIAKVLSHSHKVIANVHSNLPDKEKFEKTVLCDVSYIEDLKYRFYDINDLNGIIYCVGNCPPEGFANAIKYPLSELPIWIYKNEIRMHQMGVLNVFQTMLPKLVNGGCMLFVSSAITRLKDKWPPFLQAHYHASVISAEDWLIDGMRADSSVIKRNIKIHRVAPCAVDTAFYKDGKNPPPVLISVDEVVKEIIDALDSSVSIDKELTKF